MRPYLRRGDVTSESEGGITCDSLGDVTGSHGTHDVGDPSGNSDGSGMRTQHQMSPKRIVISCLVYEVIFTTIVSNEEESLSRYSITRDKPLTLNCYWGGLTHCHNMFLEINHRMYTEQDGYGGVSGWCTHSPLS